MRAGRRRRSITAGPTTSTTGLPPRLGPAYFCAANRGGVLAYAHPFRCTSQQFAVVVQATAPVLANIESPTLQYYAGAPAAAITSSVTVSSSQTSTLARATVKISSGFVSSEDSLRFTDQNGITGSYDASTGVLTLTGTATVADYQAALRSVRYMDSNGLTSTANRTISLAPPSQLSIAHLAA